MESFIPSRCSRLHRDTRVIPRELSAVWQPLLRFPFKRTVIRRRCVDRSAFDEAPIRRLINGQSVYKRGPLCCPRPSQTADRRFGNIWSDNILSSFTAQTGHWPLRDFPRTTMHDDWFDKHCAHTMVNTAGRVAGSRRRKIRTKKQGCSIPRYYSVIIFDFVCKQKKFPFSL